MVTGDCSPLFCGQLHVVIVLSTPFNHRYKIENNMETGICSLVISMMFAEDVGEYSCKATNQHGHTTTSGRVLLKEQYDEWLHDEQSKITKEKKRFMLEEIDTFAIHQQKGGMKSKGLSTISSCVW